MSNKNIKKILLINDLPGYGQVALSAMSPILTGYGYEVFILPTVILSNTLNYRKVVSLDTTEYIIEALKTWEELGFTFDAVSTGFIADSKQANIIYDFCKAQSIKGTKIFVDPIMADNGKLYNSVTENNVQAMKKIVKLADYLFPNITEACYLTDTKYNDEGYTVNELKRIINELNTSSAGQKKSVMITSAKIRDITSTNNKQKSVFCYDNTSDDFFAVNYAELPVKINGSGDIFSAVVIAEIISGSTLRNSVTKSVDFLNSLIQKNINIIDQYNGLPITSDIFLHN